MWRRLGVGCSLGTLIFTLLFTLTSLYHHTWQKLDYNKTFFLFLYLFFLIFYIKNLSDLFTSQ